ncbi:TfpX/TfpZ family type IV pilin accessory protein [Methylotenera sp.]|uniref:TfpX/TfpZ family type IV pilin accessory protein n=1 Tax=Methylotenera sp. TaxID=2051956 RepID=UPI00248889D7|nr:TfpX/TfpZ family type IV pilin accessory protein [Methylotenera sp.]MDI1297708.1 TfpX/TfpZ family type IV pilin accessory protein [Methylotenera sp.]
MNRFKATGIHLSISVLIVVIILSAMYVLWYPNNYFFLMGGEKLVTLIGFVDVFLGPLLTFFVFKPNKSSLKFDLSCIVILQLAALSYGIYVIQLSRPVFLVFNKDRFQVAAASDITPKELKKAKVPEWRELSVTGPKIVAIATPDKKDKKESMFAMVVSEYAYHYPRLYDQYEKYRRDVVKAGIPMTKLVEKNSKNKVMVDQFITLRKQTVNDFLFIPISTEFASMSVVIDAKTGRFIQIMNAKN